jgi:anti-sigma factor RsiW
MSRRWTFWRRKGSANEAAGLTCREMVELMTDYLEGALPEADRLRFEAHIAGCEHCTAYLEQMRETIRVVGAIDPGALEPDVERELLAAFRDWKAGGGA